MKLPSASKLSLAEKCSWPWLTTQPWPPQEDSPQSLLGKAAHRCAENYTMGIAYTIEDVATEFGVDARDLTPLDADARRILDADVYEWREAEVVLAYTPATGTARRAESRFDKRKGEQILIADLIMGGNEWITIRDWKTGKPKLQSPEETRQMQLCGLAASRVFGYDGCIVELAYLGKFRRPMAGELSGYHLEVFETWLAKMIREMPTRTEPRRGHWCKSDYCPTITICPAWESKV